MMDQKEYHPCKHDKDIHELMGDTKILKYVLGVKDKENGERTKQIEALKKKAEQQKEENIQDYKTLAQKIDSIYNEVTIQKGIRKGLEEEDEEHHQERDRILKYAFFLIAVLSLLITILNIKGMI